VTEAVKMSLIESGQVSDPASARGRLLLVAARMFHQSGFARTTVRDLGAELGIQSGSLFHHFKTKDDILCAVMEENIILNTQRLRQALTQSGPAEARVDTLVRSELEFLYGETGNAMAVVIKEWAALSEKGQQVILKLRDEYESLWVENLRQARSEGAGLVEMDEALLRRLIAGSVNWTLNWYRREGTVCLDELADDVLKLALK